MSPLYLYNSKLLVKDGALATNENCCCDDCPKYPVKCYISGGLYYSGGVNDQRKYRSLEIQCIDANNNRVFDWRDYFPATNATFLSPRFFANGFPFPGPDGCTPVLVHTFNAATDLPFNVCNKARLDYCKLVSPADFSCPVEYGSGTVKPAVWCPKTIGLP